MKKTASPKRGFTLVEIMIVVAIIGILIAIAVPGYMNAREQSRAKACKEAQDKLDGATQQYVLAENLPADTTPTWAVLVGSGSYLSTTPICPEANKAVALHSADTVAVCPSSVGSHAR